MPRTVFTTTISLPKSMAADLKVMTRAEGRGVSELVREALRTYEEVRGYSFRKEIAWDALRASLARVSRAGKTQNLAAFIAHDRLAH